jgi:energy-coupling factor transport system permease protein
MHPVIRIISFIVLAAFLASGRAVDLACGALLTACLYLFLFSASLPAALHALYRTRWLFLSLLIVYAWFTPGETLALRQFPALEPWLPSREGLVTGASRALSLALIIMMANLLLRITAQAQLLAALLWLTRPLGAIGLPHDRFAIRAVLTIEVLGEVRTLVARVLEGYRGRRAAFRALGGFAADIFAQVIDSAQRTAPRSVHLPIQQAPPLYEWLYPLTLGATLTLAGVVYP